GWGRYPVVVAKRLKAMGFQVVCLGVRDHVDPAIVRSCDAYTTIGMARLGKAIRFFRRHGVSQATMAGKIHKVLLFQPYYWVHHFPDWTCIRTFFPHFVTRSQDRRDDTMLMTIIRAFGRHGIRFAPATDFAPDLLVRPAQLAGPPLGYGLRKDIAFGWKLAREIG